jgi:purine nucleosidase
VPNSIRVIIDTDPGIDDVVALALAALSPELDVAAVTTTYGNVTLDLTTSNARQALRLVGREDIPVYPGSDRPFVRDLVTAADTHGASGIGYATPGDVLPVQPNPEVLVDILRAEADPVILVTLGPLTNLAAAIKQNPKLVCSAVSRHIGMFGNINERGNTNRWADFNAWCDPEAVAVVLESALPTEMVGLDVTRRMVVSRQEVEWLEGRSERLLSWFGKALRLYVEFHQAQETLDGCVVNDILTIGELLHPGLMQFEPFALAVNLSEDESRGRTRPAEGGNHTMVAMEVEIEIMRNLLDRVFSGDWRKVSCK